MAREKMFIPTFISNAAFESARVRPRLFFYNGKLETTPYSIGGFRNTGGSSSTIFTESEFPYIDHYTTGSVSTTKPDAGSKSLLFFNEAPAYGSTPTGSLFTEYWSKYIGLLYNPKTRLIECSAVIPFATYVDLELNDIIFFRGNHYHLRAINQYDLKTGECQLQLLGPILSDALDDQYGGL
jgi:hypothetical protein